MPRRSWLPALPGRKGKLGNALFIEVFLPGVTEIPRGNRWPGTQGVGSWSHLGVEGQLQQPRNWLWPRQRGSPGPPSAGGGGRAMSHALLGPGERAESCSPSRTADPALIKRKEDG